MRKAKQSGARKTPANITRLLRDRRGATAVEFAIVAAPFFALLIAILETALMFFAQQVLQTATTQSARLIMTGQAQTQAMTASKFQQAVCANAVALFTCSNIYVNVQKFTSFGGVSQLNPIQSGTFNTSTMNYTPGGPGDIVLVQVFYAWPTVLAPLGFNLSNMNGNNHLLVGTAVFRNEPY
ncbi:MAG: pilus assembly protein [Alphaproteobacteria bacterium]|nr:pilus assembly protein [Reyranella sp.]MBL6852525.1 pilus assembly protein [Alphaproteobacteria bacterium]MBL6940488.1 pilus assembly protein [Alphaproteobacteria bacterium]